MKLMMNTYIYYDIMREEGFTIISFEEFSYICRSCCLKNEDLTPLEETKYFDLFKTITGIQIEADDELPNNICNKCINILEEVSSFITISKNNDIHLKEILQRSKAKILDDSDVTNLSCDVKDDPEDSDASEELCGKAKTEQENNEPKTGKSKKQLSEHQKNNACRERNFKCSDCDKAFHTKYRLNVHKRSHTKETPYECKICLKKFRYAETAKRHDNVVHKGSKPFKCEVCGREFSRRLAKNDHLHTHTGDGKEFLCSECGKVFRKKALLQIHSRIHTGETPFVCKYCGMRFMYIGSYKSHVLLHTGESPFVCKYCGKQIRYYGSYKSHLLLHTGETPYNCKICKKGFVQKLHLKEHMKVHTGEKPYNCKFCDKDFAYKNNLKVHERIHTGETPYYCSMCGKGFYDSSTLKKHEKAHRNQNKKK